MEYPHIALKIENFTPSINFVKDENTSRKITINDENLLVILSTLTKQLDLIEDEIESTEDLYLRILELAREAVTEGMNDIPGLDAETTEFEIQKVVDNVQTELESDDLEGVIYDVAVRDEIIRNQNIDTLGTVLESIYAVMILKTLLAASDLGIGTIVLDDKHKDARLMEKMASELQKMDLELIIQDLA